MKTGPSPTLLLLLTGYTDLYGRGRDNLASWPAARAEIGESPIGAFFDDISKFNKPLAESQQMTYRFSISIFAG